MGFVNDKLCEKAIVAYSKVPFYRLHGGSKGTYENLLKLRHYKRSLGR
jgi:hypothetical protein